MRYLLGTISFFSQTPPQICPEIKVPLQYDGLPLTLVGKRLYSEEYISGKATLRLNSADQSRAQVFPILDLKPVSQGWSDYHTQ